MISFIKGKLAEVLADSIVLEAGSIGFQIYVPLSVVESLPGTGTEVTIYTYMQVREDAMNLYGFLSRQDLDMFRQLIGVNGIGPKGALGILSAIRPDDLRLAILSGDAKAISKAPGVGTKTAQRVILDLKDKVSAEDILASVDSGPQPAGGEALKESGREAVDALVALGYSNLEASKAVKQVTITEQMTSEDVLKASLKYLAFL